MLRIVLLWILAVCLAPVHAQPDLEAEQRAVASGDYQEALDLLTGRRGSSAEFFYLLAKTHYELGNFDSAERALARARAETDDTRYRLLQLLILQASTPESSASSVSDGRRLSLAQAVLETDPHNTAAHLEIGLHNAVDFYWYQDFLNAHEPEGGAVERRAKGSYDEAVRHFGEALRSEPDNIDVAAQLVRIHLAIGDVDAARGVAAHSRRQSPNDPHPWLLSGLAATIDGAYERAADYFDRALNLMDPSRRSIYESTSLFRGDLFVPNKRFWRQRDPLFLTLHNERHTDHLARMVYADLWFGKPDRPGWQTERGEIVLRYGIPPTQYTITGTLSRFTLFDYDDFKFVFEDITRSGSYTLYSPKAGAGSSWESDYVIQAAEMRRSLPDRFEFGNRTTVPLATRIWVFASPSSGTDMYVEMRISPAEAATELSSRTERRFHAGTILLDPSGEALSRDVDLTEALHTTDRGWRRLSRHTNISPGRYVISSEILSEDEQISGVSRDSVDLDRPSTESFLVSDLVIASSVTPAGESSVPNTIMRPSYAVEPRSSNTVRNGEDLLVYFEIYDLRDPAMRRPFRIEAEIASVNDPSLLGRLFGGRDRSTVAVSFTETDSQSQPARFFSIDPGELEAGDYQLTVRVTDSGTGTSMSQRTPITIE